MCENCVYWSATENEKECCQYRAKGPDDSPPCGKSKPDCEAFLEKKGLI